MEKNEISDTAKQAGEAFARLYDIIVKLRGPEGCPWDKAQTSESLHPHLIEESYELMEGIRRNDDDNTAEEIGDVYLVNTMIARVLEEKNEQMHMVGILNNLCEKLIRRHPHVFGENKVKTPEEGHASWMQVKAQEKKEKGEEDAEGLLHRCGRGLPPLEQAEKIQKKMAKAGFSWAGVQEILNKVEEEFKELKNEITSHDLPKIREELGDMFFTLAGLAHQLGIEAGEAVYQANNKIINRVHAVEAELKKKGLSFAKENRTLIEDLWQKIKKRGS